jgi:hypothetical protein
MFHVEFDQAALDFLDISHGIPNGLFQKLQGGGAKAHYNRTQFLSLSK